MSFMNRLLQIAASRRCRGCSLEELDALERRYNVRLPNAYRQFLEVGGRGIEDFLVGSDYHFDQLTDLQNWAEELLFENQASPLPDQAFVFFMHQGYQFYFFIGESIFYYLEGADSYEKRFDSFEELFEVVFSESGSKSSCD